MEQELKLVDGTLRKDAAIRAKEIAEKNFIERDIFSARHHTVIAQSLFPDLEGIDQMLTTLGVYICALTKIKGETYWYGVLGLDPLADDDTVREQYGKLALMIHPDKNKSIGADGAFKLISEAWDLLSDKAKRLAYDERINAKAFKQYAMAHQEATAKEQASNSGNESKPKTFWTFCNRCQIQFEYPRVYVNRILRCYNCKGSFLAGEIAQPPGHEFSLAASWIFLKYQKLYFHKALGQRKFRLKKATSTPIDKLSRTSSGVSSVAQAADVVQRQHVYERTKRVREEAQAAMKIEGDLCRQLQDLGKDFLSDPAKRRKGMEDSSLSSHGVVEGSKTTSNAELQNLLMEEDINDIIKKLSEMETFHTDATAVKEGGNDYQKANGKEEDMVKVNNEDTIIKHGEDKEGK